jgi:phytanoyl-CoA hydroxylase
MGITAEHLREYERDGYTIVRTLFAPEEAAHYRAHFMALRGQGAFPGDLAAIDPASDDPLLRYPRMIHMHRWDELSLRWLLDARLAACLTALLGVEPFAVQTMLYFKPPGARGQALHQDQYYLRVRPGTCIAAWLALDDCDAANGCLQVVPGSHRWPLLCTEKADTTVSFTDITVPIPPGTEVRDALMAPGDVIFFHGSLVHGSGPNRTSDRFRRSLIGHYIQGDARQVARFYSPALRMDGTPVEIADSPGGGACGVWVDRDGTPVIEVSGSFAERGRVSE